MSVFDLMVPEDLKKTQCWFGSIIQRPIDVDSQMLPYSPSGRAMEEEAADYILPSPTLRPAQRIQIYNQQYWWRLIGIIHDTYPLVTRLFGYHDVNQTIIFPYLTKYLSQHWSLNFLGDRLPVWIEEEYTASDKALILDAARVDFAYNRGFVVEEFPSLEQVTEGKDLEKWLNVPLRLQPHVFLFELPYDLFGCRNKFLKESPEYWVENDFPPLESAGKEERLYFLLYRNPLNEMVYSKMTYAENQIIKKFIVGTTVTSICEWLESQKDNPLLYEDASQNLHLWFQRWTALRLLCL